jgi:ribosomal protein S18 acetylase RimI-like enzyme
MPIREPCLNDQTTQLADGISVRSLSPADQEFLWEMLYQALYAPPGAPAFPREIVHQPEIRRYVEGWGRPGDMGFVAMEAQQSVAAVWIRLWAGEDCGYGYVDDETPELSIAVLPACRARGIGTGLMARMLAAARSEYPAISLSVSANNPAVRLYERLGFERVGESGSSLTMCKRFMPLGARASTPAPAPNCSHEAGVNARAPRRKHNG